MRRKKPEHRLLITCRGILRNNTQVRGLGTAYVIIIIILIMMMYTLAKGLKVGHIHCIVSNYGLDFYLYSGFFVLFVFF